MNPSILELTKKDKETLTGLISSGVKLVNNYISPNPEKIQPSTLDEVFLAFLKDQRQFANEDVANGLGAIFGDMLEQELAMVWRTIEDEYGREYALIHEETGSVVFPINSVWKRLEPEMVSETIFEPMWNTVKEHLTKGKFE